MLFAKRVDYMTRNQKSSKKILASGFSSYHAGQTGIFQLGSSKLEKSHSIWVYIPDSISRFDITYLTTRSEKICKEVGNYTAVL